MINQRTQTDNANIDSKIHLRMMAIEGLEKINVLDCFAGENRIWSRIPHDSYYGIETKKGKGKKNLFADNLRVIPSLDLSKYNVIDIDSYGLPLDQILAIHKNKTLIPGTVIIYTMITSKISAAHKSISKAYGADKMYAECPCLFEPYLHDMAYGIMYNLGIKNVMQYSGSAKAYDKRYGYYRVGPCAKD